MRILTAVILLMLLKYASGYDAIGMRSFLDSARKSTETIRGVIHDLGSQIRATFEHAFAPQLQKAVEIVEETLWDIVETMKRLEKALEDSLETFDDIVIDIGQEISVTADIVIVMACIFFYGLCSMMNSSSSNMHFKHEFLTLLMVLSLLTATGVTIRVFYVSVLKLELVTTVATLKYCVLYPIAIVILWKVLRCMWYILGKVGSTVCFFLGGPRFIIFLAIDGPVLWVWRAHKYGQEKNIRTPILMALTSPWVMFFLCLCVYNFLIMVNERKDQLAFMTSLIVAYVYFYVTAIYLYVHHQGPAKQEPTNSKEGKC